MHGVDRHLISATPPTREQHLLAIGVLVFLVGALLATMPFARIRLQGTEQLVPAYAASVFLIEVITAASLLGLFSVERSRAILVLAAGYVFSAALLVPWVLSFPGVFEAFGLESGLQSTAAISAAKRIGFPLFVLCYVLLKDSEDVAGMGFAPFTGPVLIGLATVLLAAGSLAWFFLAFPDLLPTFMTDERDVTPVWHYVPAVVIPLYLAVLGALWARLRCALDLWLMVVISALLIELVLLSYVSAGFRLSVGWWAGRLYGLISASIVLFALMAETTTLYARLARSVAAERRTRAARLTAMEALSALIAHEVNQPVSSMVTNANAALRWLGKPTPELNETSKALERIVNDGHRAGAVIDGIRAMFKKAGRERGVLDVNRLIAEVLVRIEQEARLAGILIETKLDAGLPDVNANPVQLQQVVTNLIMNAMEAIGMAARNQRLVRVTSHLDASGDIVVSVADRGGGVDPQDAERIFAPFFTTKSHGMGMGLMFCRLVIEAHGGRLWTEANQPQGAIFRFTLPPSSERHPG
jgi:signal transduction histidine kinase